MTDQQRDPHRSRTSRTELRKPSYKYDQVTVFFTKVEKQFDAERITFELNGAGALDIQRQIIIVIRTYK